jgi:hypothetical protein
MNEIENILKLSPPVALMLALLLCGKMLKMSPVDSRWIPFILPVLGAIAFPLIMDPALGVSHPTAHNAILGFLAGGAAVGVHSAMVRVKPEPPSPVVISVVPTEEQKPAVHVHTPTQSNP